MIRQYLANSGAPQLPVPEGLTDFRSKLTKVIDDMRTSASQPNYGVSPLPGIIGKPVAASRETQPVSLGPIPKMPDPPRVEPEDIYGTKKGLAVPPQDDAVEKAKKLLEQQAAAAPVPAVPAAPATPDVQVAANPPANVAEFVSQMTPHVLEVSRLTGLDPRLVLAQMALETGYGKGVVGNNYFNVKSHGQPGGQERDTFEEVDGKMVPRRESFRTYKDPAESARDYVTFLKTQSRYKDYLNAKGLDAQLEALGKSGYATDSKYIEKLRGIIKSLPAIVPPKAVTPDASEPDTRARGGPIYDLLATARNYR
jgi:flagellum-specific peptidoglycan hydrolase FlgJ